MLKNMRIGTRLFWQALGMAFWFIVLVIVATYQMRELDRTSGALYLDKLEPGTIILRIQTLMAESNQQLAAALLHDPAGRQAARLDHALDSHPAQLVKHDDQINQLWATFRQRDLGEVEQQLAGDYERARGVFFKDGVLPAVDALKTGNFELAGELYAHQVEPAYGKASAAAEALRQYYLQSGRELFDGAREADAWANRLLVGLAALVIALIAAFSYVFARSITVPLAGAVGLADAVASGQLDNHIDTGGRDQVADLSRALEKMQSELKRRIDADRLAAAEMMRIKVALDVTSNNVMVADPAGQIIYCNKSVLEMMRQAESDIRTQLPQFRADQILGSNFDIYHRQPSHQRNLLAGLRGIHRTEMTVGGRHFSLVACPIIDPQGERLGTVVEWRDRTAEVEIEREVAHIIESAVGGDFSKRLDAGKMSGFFRQISDGINALLEANTRALGDVGNMLSRMSAGDLRQKIDNEYQGTLGQLKNDANATVDNLQRIVLSIKEATDAINTAAKEIASGNQDLSSRTEEQASSLEETASSMEELTSTVKQNADNARQANDLAGTITK